MQPIQQPSPDNKRWQVIGKAAWICVILLAVFIAGIVIGSASQANALEKALLNENLSVCKDTDGKVWIREQVKNVPDALVPQIYGN